MAKGMSAGHVTSWGQHVGGRLISVGSCHWLYVLVGSMDRCHAEENMLMLRRNNHNLMIILKQL